MSALTDKLQNSLIDWLLRGQALGLAGASAAAGTGFTNVYAALFTTATDEAASGIEVTGGDYARVAVPCTLASWAGTQGPGSTGPSTGTSGLTSNNGAVLFPVPTADWGIVTHAALFDSLTGGEMLAQAPLVAPKEILNGATAPSFPPGTMVFALAA